MRRYRQLEVWQLSHRLTLAVYRVTGRFPESERFGLAAQMRRCSVAIGSNIAEGAGRPGRADFARFIGMALGSTNELESQLLVARDLGFVDSSAADELEEVTARVRSMLIRLHQSLLRPERRPGEA